MVATHKIYIQSLKIYIIFQIPTLMLSFSSDRRVVHDFDEDDERRKEEEKEERWAKKGSGKESNGLSETLSQIKAHKW